MFEGNELFRVKIRDDVSAVSKKVVSSIDELDKHAKHLGDTFRKTNTGNLTVGLKEADRLWKSSAGNIKIFQAALKDAGASLIDTRLLVSRFSSELTAMRRQALGMDGVFRRIFDPRTIWVASHSLNVLSKGLGAVRAVAGGVAGVLGSIYDVGKSGIDSVIDAATKRQNATETMAYMFEKPGTSEKDARKQAGDMFAWAQKYAKDTPLDTADITGAVGQFVTAGFDQRQAKILTQVMADQASKFMDRPEMKQNVIAAYSRMQGRGVATGEDLESLRVAGFNASKVMESLRALPELKGMFSGIKASDTDEEKAKKTKEVLGKGKVGTMSLIQASIDSLEKDKPDLGEMAKKLGATSLAGTLSNLKSAWTDLLQSVDLQEWPGVKALQGFIQKISASLDASGESGKRLLKTVETAIGNILGGLGEVEQSDIDDFIGRIGDAAMELSRWIKDAWEWLHKLVKSDVSIVDTLGDVLLDVGVWIGQGIWKGVTTGTKALTDERYEKRHGVKKSEIEYQAQLSGRPFSEVEAEFDAKYGTFQRLGRTVDVPWGGDAARATYDQVMGQRFAQSAVAGQGVLAAGPTDALGPSGFGALAEEVSRLNANIAGLNESMGGVPKMASGGIVTRPTMALIGEAGPEAVVPLGSGGSSSVFGGDRSVTVVVHAGSGDAAQQWEAIRPLITREVTAVLTRVGAEA